MILAAEMQAQPDYVALAMVAVMLLFVIGAVLRKRFADSGAQPAVQTAPAVKPQLSTAPGSAGAVKLHDVEPKVAAMLMAIVADKTGKPLNELRFLSIREVKE
ncbi:MAG: hypothetical protein Q4F17_01495 [Eubacteriales bacterium]|nr:hypothetical protein [Eubacteriales bacterium]